MAPAQARAQDPIYDKVGATYGREFISPLPFEHIDTVTGGVLLTFTDLVLPGNGGLNLTLTRAYNSIDGRWRFGINGVPMSLEFNMPSNNLDDVDFVTVDGGRHRAHSS